jgi:hypothetical protein
VSARVCNHSHIYIHVRACISLGCFLVLSFLTSFWVTILALCPSPLLLYPPCEPNLPKPHLRFCTVQRPQLTKVLILSHPAAAYRNATASHSGLSSTLARCQNCPPLLCKCAWPWLWLWPGVLEGRGMHVATATAIELLSCWAGGVWRAIPCLPAQAHPQLLHVDVCVSCEFSAVLWVGWAGRTWGQSCGIAGASQGLAGVNRK